MLNYVNFDTRAARKINGATDDGGQSTNHPVSNSARTAA